MERVDIDRGSQPIILVAPHGNNLNDENTGILTESVSNHIQAYKIINWGFIKSEYVDTNKDLADCNRVDHATADVVREEFLDPLRKFASNIVYDPLDSEKVCFILWIHGVGADIESKVGDKVDLIVGYGKGKNTSSYTCDKKIRNLFMGYFSEVYKLRQRKMPYIWQANGGSYSGRSRNNMNQYFRLHQKHPNVHSLQLEIPWKWREPSRAVEFINILRETLTYIVSPKAIEYDFEERFTEV